MPSIRRPLAAMLGALTLAMLAAPWSADAAEPAPLKVGAAKVDITPTSLNGFYSVWATRFDGVRDPIYARAVVIDNGTFSAALVSTDLVEFGDSSALRKRVERELGIPADHVIITASHDHNAPRAGPITPGTSSANGRPYSPPAYIKLVDDRIIEALRKAKASAQPGRVGVGAGRADINVNRQGYNGRGWGGADLEGPSDKTVWVVKFESLSGEPIAILMNYAVHSVVAGPGNRLVTGDLAGAAQRVVEQHYGDKVVALWTMGPAGDQNPRYASNDRTNTDGGKFAYEAAAAQGLIVGVEAFQAAERIKRLDPTATISAGESVFSCAVQPPRPPPPATANAGPIAPSPFPPNPDFKEVIPSPTSFDIRLSKIRINDIAIVGVSGEVFTPIYARLKKEAPLSNLVMVTMANDRIGYIGDDASYDMGFRNPAVVRGCAETGIVDGLIKLMAQP